MEITVATKSDAEAVLAAAKERVLQYGALTVHDLYALVSLPGTFKDNYQGWGDLSKVRIEEHDTECTMIFPVPNVLRYN